MAAVLDYLFAALARCGFPMGGGRGAGAGKPGMPAGYRVPRVWSNVESGGAFSAINAPTAGARWQSPMPTGDAALQLYSLGTPNGQKVTILLEELGLPFDGWLINIGKKNQFSSGFVDVNPNSKIPALLDRNGPGGKPTRVFESAHILLYLAEKAGKFIPKDAGKRVEMLNWLFFNAGSGPFFGQFNHFYKYAPAHIEYGVNRYTMEAKRLLDVLDQQLAGKQYIIGEVTIADFAIYPWVKVFQAEPVAEFVQFSSYKNLCAWCERLAARPGVKKGLNFEYTKLRSPFVEPPSA